MTLADLPKLVLQGILEDLSQGLLENDVAKKWVSVSTYYRWKKDVVRIDENGEQIFEFAEAVEKAIVTYKEKIYKAINLHTIKSGKTALEVLRRRFPDEWNVSKKVDLGGKVDLGVESLAKEMRELIDLPDDEQEEDTRNTEVNP